MSLQAPFTPVTPTASATSGAPGSSAATALPKAFATQAMITSISTNPLAYIKFGDSTVAAAATDTPILPGSQVILTPPVSATHFAVFGVTAAQLFVTSGYGE